MLVTVLSLVLALSILVFVHEFGHYVAAKLSGVVVEEFALGYPPRLLAFWHTRGKIVIDGREIVIPRAFRVPKDLHVGSLVLYETDQDAKGQVVLAQIEQVDPDESLAASASLVTFLDPGTIFTINMIPFGGFAKMLGEEDPTYPGSLASKGKLSRIFVLSAGALMNLLTAVFFFTFAMGLGAPAVADPENAVITAVAPGSPAEAVDLRANDLILRADETEILTIQTLQEYTQAHLGESIVLTIQRGQDVVEITVVPRVSPPAGEGPMGIGLSPRTTIIRYPWYEAVWSAAKQTVTLAGFIFTVPVQMIRGLIPVELARPVGPVGVGQIIGDAVQYSLDSGWWYPAMQIMGTLSVALAITNLLPLPGLDGGRILFVIVEGIRGRRIDPAKEGLVHLIGLALMVALMLFVTWQDLVNPVPPVDWSSFF
jgi:regulator of sigma E protease